MATTAEKAKKSNSSKSSRPIATDSDVQQISGIVKDLLNGPHFPELKTIPNIHYVCMAVFAYEATDFLIVRELGKTGKMTSRHPTASFNSSTVRKAYLGDPKYLAYASRTDLTPEQRHNLGDGAYAHGLTAAMGFRFIRGTRGNRDLLGFRTQVDYFASIGSPVEVNLGESITSLFTGPDKRKNFTASLAQGLLALNFHYRLLAKRREDPVSRLMLAVGAYVGTGKDNNGYTGVDRILDVANVGNTKLAILKRNGIQPADPIAFSKINTTTLVAKFTGGKSPSGQVASAGNTRVAQAPTTAPSKPTC